MSNQITEKDLKYIIVEVDSMHGGGIKRGLLESYNPKLSFIKFIEKAGDPYMCASLNHYSILRLTICEGAVVSNNFFKNHIADQDEAAKLLKLYTLRYGSETSLESEFRLIEKYSAIPKLYVKGDNKMPVTGTTGTGTTGVNQVMGVNNYNRGGTAANTVRSGNVYNANRQPAVIIRKEEVTKVALQTMKGMVEQIGGGMQLELPETDGGTEAQLKPGHSARQRFVDGTWNHDYY